MKKKKKKKIQQRQKNIQKKKTNAKPKVSVSYDATASGSEVFVVFILKAEQQRDRSSYSRRFFCISLLGKRRVCFGSASHANDARATAKYRRIE